MSSSGCPWAPWPLRSEEHTSELQSQSNLVCRLLLEKTDTARATLQLRGAIHRLHAGLFEIAPLVDRHAAVRVSITPRFHEPHRQPHASSALRTVGG